jgi:alpha-mannosidase
MTADSINITSASETLGEIAVRGRLLDRQGKTLADFQQTYRLWRGSRVLLLDIEIEPHEEPHADPWNSYIASRFAWADESAEMWRSLHQMRHAVTQNRFEAPHYIEIVHGQCRMSILTGGLPFHRRVGLRMLDSLLVVRGERQRRFRFGIGIGLSHPLHEAMSLMAPPPMLHQVAASPAPSASSWLFHIDGKNVVATHWEPLSEENRVHGFRARLLETAGRPARLTLSSFRPVASARQMNFLNEPLSDCQIDQGKIRLELSAHEWVEVQAAFEK